ncbi:hypothetical protein SK066_06655 [Paenibacillus hunanensis]|uniref:hypothetical protein n=1 Tax=Paenibacillus hunanensis TaxID=539262 RepID=UPI002A6A75FA|nr:hypothetical protein [Paenibacillus hunanensis]WPP42615.1 hypothetical protein SK066_06655 [Paenibacillus hunanensis]
MSLQLMKTYDVNATCIKSVEAVSEDLILFNIEMRSTLNFDSRPYHWRCDFGNVPPLDLSLDSETGLIKEITVFISKKTLIRDYNCNCMYSNELKGYPSFNTKIWTKHEYYYDEFLDIGMYLDNSMLNVLLKGRVASVRLEVNNVLDILFDEKNLFIGFVVKNLDSKELYFFER